MEKNIINLPVKAISLGFVEDYEVVRLYTNRGRLLAKLLLDNHLVVENETYKTALKHLPVDELLSPMTALTLSPTRDAQLAVPAVKVYTLSSLEKNTNFQVTVLNIQNSMKKFTIFNKLEETERSKIVSQLMSFDSVIISLGKFRIIFSKFVIHVHFRRI